MDLGLMRPAQEPSDLFDDDHDDGQVHRDGDSGDEHRQGRDVLVQVEEWIEIVARWRRVHDDVQLHVPLGSDKAHDCISKVYFIEKGGELYDLFLLLIL